MPDPTPDELLTKRLLGLAVEVGSAITKRESLAEMLDACACALVNYLGAGLARIWVFNEKTKMLDLAASAGLFNVNEGPTQSVPLGDRNVGGIALKKQPVLTNSIAESLDLRDLDWIVEQGMVGFAGHPLLVQGRLVGVMVLLSRSALRDDTLTALAAVADNIASGIERTKTEQRLRESQTIFEQFADHIHDFMFIKSAGSKEISYASPGYDWLFGRPREELIADPFAFMDLLVPEDRDRMWEHLKTAQMSLEPTEIEYRIITPQGERRWILARTFPVLNAAGELVQRCGIVSDISQRKEAERRVSEFYSMVSHELRTPLTSIKAALGLIQGGQVGGVSDEAADLVNIATGESDRLIRLINDILDIRKVQAGKLDVSIQRLSAEEVVSTTIASMRGLSLEAHVSLCYSVLNSSEVLGDRDRVIQVLTNLLSNAIKFSPPKSQVEVTVEKRSDDFVCFSIADQGPGIADHEKPRLFSMFQQLDSSDSRARGGTGLGLAISKAIVEELGGRIDFDSAPGRGSTFWFELPVATPL